MRSRKCLVMGSRNQIPQALALICKDNLKSSETYYFSSKKNINENNLLKSGGVNVLNYFCFVKCIFFKRFDLVISDSFMDIFISSKRKIMVCHGSDIESIGWSGDRTQYNWVTWIKFFFISFLSFCDYFWQIRYSTTARLK